MECRSDLLIEVRHARPRLKCRCRRRQHHGARVHRPRRAVRRRDAPGRAPRAGGAFKDICGGAVRHGVRACGLRDEEGRGGPGGRPDRVRTSADGSAPLCPCTRLGSALTTTPSRRPRIFVRALRRFVHPRFTRPPRLRACAPSRPDAARAPSRQRRSPSTARASALRSVGGRRARSCTTLARRG